MDDKDKKEEDERTMRSVAMSMGCDSAAPIDMGPSRPSSSSSTTTATSENSAPDTDHKNLTSIVKDSITNTLEAVKNLTQPDEVKPQNLEKVADLVASVKDTVKDKMHMANEEVKKDNNPRMGPYEVPGMAGLSGFDPISGGLAYEMDREDQQQQKVEAGEKKEGKDSEKKGEK